MQRRIPPCQLPQLLVENTRWKNGAGITNNVTGTVLYPPHTPPNASNLASPETLFSLFRSGSTE